MRHEISPEDVKVGMYVQGFGGSWMDHPFWRARFVVREKDLPRIRSSGVPFVIVDDELGLPPEPRKAQPAPVKVVPAGTILFARRRPVPSVSRPIDPAFDEARRNAERKRAVALVARSLRVLRGVFGDVRLGRAVRMPEVVAVVDEVVDSMERSPRTLLEVIRLKRKDEYTYLHSVAVCTLMVNLARHLGKDEATARAYGLAGLLHDLGKMSISESILNKTGALTPDELDEVRQHPEQGYEFLLQTPNIPELALDVCRHHHERIDGSGYPFGLTGDAISEVSRIGAICDVYDALTSDRVYKKAWTPVEAVTAMWNWQGQFDRPLLFAFLQSIGVFPARMLVMLRSNRLGVVLEPRRRQARPRVLAFYCTRERLPLEPVEVTISDSLANDSIVAPADPADWDIDDVEAYVARLQAAALEGGAARLAG